MKDMMSLADSVLPAPDLSAEKGCAREVNSGYTVYDECTDDNGNEETGNNHIILSWSWRRQHWWWRWWRWRYARWWCKWKRIESILIIMPEAVTKGSNSWLQGISKGQHAVCKHGTNKEDTTTTYEKSKQKHTTYIYIQKYIETIPSDPVSTTHKAGNIRPS